jgi:hypothetical protein
MSLNPSLKTPSLKTSKSHANSHIPNVIAAVGMNRAAVTKRRSNRMALNASIKLSGEDRQKCSFTMTARATNLNRHGAVVQLSRELQIGSVIVLHHKSGAQVSARVVAQLAGHQGALTYGVEFVETEEKAENFWGIMFPSNA